MKDRSCPALTDLPAPPPGKSGWPWTQESVTTPATLPDGSPWPRVTVVTPSYNQGRYLEETIRSVLLQGYPDLEYLIMDGGSTDESVQILRRYEPWLAYWVSEKDRGQAEAINKGFRRASGEIVAWLNSDDTYLPGAVAVAAAFLHAHADIALVYGDCNYVDESGAMIRPFAIEAFERGRLLHCHDYIPQPATFIRRATLSHVGMVQEELRYVMDYELWLRISATYPVACIPDLLATYRLATGSKTTSHHRALLLEEHRVARRYGRSPLKWFGYWLPAHVKYRGGRLLAALRGRGRASRRP